MQSVVSQPAAVEIESGTVLIVDDDLVNLRILEAVLRKNRHRVLTATNGPDAIALARDAAPDIILMDIMMPEMSGLEACSRLKEDEATQDIPLVFVTAVRDNEDLVDGFQRGAVDYLTKPFNMAELLVRIRTHIELRRSRRLIEAMNRRLRVEIEERKLYEQKQEVNIDLARSVLRLVNRAPPRHIALSDGMSLFVEGLSMPCHAEGGDHFLVRALSGRATISLKDQSGHEVGCILRSIITDLFHNALLTRRPEASVEETVSRLNDEICKSGMFAGDDFYTSLDLSIDRATREMDYVSAGHPSMVAIRGADVRLLPPEGGEGTNLPAAMQAGVRFRAGRWTLREGDRLVLFTDGLNEMPLRLGGRVLSPSDVAERIAELLREDPRVPVSVLIRRLIGRVAEESGESVAPGVENTSGDDITVLGIEVERPEVLLMETWTSESPSGIREHVRLLLPGLLEAFAARGFHPDRDAVRTALEEATLNAWTHGGGGRADRPVRVAALAGNDASIEVTDSGEGFDWRAPPDPTHPDNRVRPSGRGLFLIRRACTDVGWREGGRTIAMAFSHAHAGPGMGAPPIMSLWD